MATIRVRDWTKERIEEIREAESHSSHDSVIKTLLKDRELAQFAGEAVPESETETGPPEGSAQPADKAFDDLTVLSELEAADNGLLFLWCPNCGKEIAHVGVENPVSMSVFEAECQRCLTRLDQHAIVAIEIGYPIEQRIVDGTLEDDLRRCVVDYWDRTLERVSAGEPVGEPDDEQFVLTIERYYREFDWDWPADVPVVALEPGRTYRNDATGERFEVLDVESENRNAPNSYRVRRRSEATGTGDDEATGTGDDEATDTGDVEATDTGETDVIDANTALNLVSSRDLYLATEGD